jgi:hypothetical protein
MEREAPPAARHLWQHRYEEYLTDSTMLYRAMVDKEERNMKFQELYEKYKHVSIHPNFLSNSVFNGRINYS